MKGRGLVIVLVGVIVGLSFFLLRENERRVSAESRLQKVQASATSAISEKGEVIADLSTQVGEMQAQLQQVLDECRQTVSERDLQIAQIQEETRLAAAEHETAIQQKDAEIKKIEAEMKDNTDAYDKALKKKNTELSEMGEELRKTTERLAAALKEKEKIEAESYDLRQRVSGFERKQDRLAADNRRLEALVKACVESPSVPETADMPSLTNPSE